MASEHQAVLDAERSLVGAILLDASRAPDAAAIVAPEDFLAQDVRLVFEVVVALDNARAGVDCVTVAHELDRRGQLDLVGRRAGIVELANCVTSAAHLTHHARIVTEAATLRRLEAWSRRKAEESSELAPDAGSVREFLEDAERELLAITRSRDAAKTPTVARLVDEIESSLGQGGRRGLSTGLVDLDALLNGLKPGQLVIGAGRPGMGKTGLACKLAESAAIRENAEGVIYFSLEMDPRSIVERVIAARARISTRDIERGSIPGDRRSAWDETVTDLRASGLSVSSRSRTVQAMRGEARRWKQKHGLALIVVDYLQLMRGPKSDSRQEEVASISRELKEMAEEFAVPVLAMAQLNRQAEVRSDKRPGLADLRESGAIEQDADVVVLVFREDYYKKPAEYDHKAELIVAKHRNGPTGTIVVGFEAQSVRFFNAAPVEAVAWYPGMK